MADEPNAVGSVGTALPEGTPEIDDGLYGSAGGGPGAPAVHSVTPASRKSRRKLRRWSLRRYVSGRPVFWPLIILVGVGIALRIVVEVAAWPTMFEWVDAVRYARVDPTQLFGDFWMPAGYPVFLDILHAINGSVGFTILVQHCLGVVTAVLFYLISRRLGVGRYLSLVPCAVVMLSGDEIYLEHIMMGDSFYLFTLTLALYLFVRALGSPSNVWALVVAGLVTGLACLTRTTALALPVVLIVWLAFARVDGQRRIKMVLRRLTYFGVPILVVVVGYVGVASAIGPYAGMFDMSGFHLYARVAPFAQCSQFIPPAETRKLCQKNPVTSRFGPEYYEWDLTSPVRRDFSLSPATARLAGAFADQVIIHQPVDYLKAVGLDLARYVDPSLGHLPAGFGEGHSLMSFSNFDPQQERQLSAQLSTRYSGATPPSRRWLSDLADVQGVLRVGPVLMLVFLAAVLGGLVFARRRTRGGLLAVSTLALLLFLGPVATFTYDIRYGVPPDAFLALAAALGVQALWSRFGHPKPEGLDRAEPALPSAAVA
jgi:4-amino-4-deoxy-L-arabinose transferase-like glycosyltransferase